VGRRRMIIASTIVEHAEFGIGKVLAILGDVATVDFFGEAIDVAVNDLLPRNGAVNGATPVARPRPTNDIAFRKSFEAVNLGVVPAEPEQLVNLTIGGDVASSEICSLLAAASTRGLSRIFMGYYGSGKSHHLQLVK